MQNLEEKQKNENVSKYQSWNIFGSNSEICKQCQGNTFGDPGL